MATYITPSSENLIQKHDRQNIHTKLTARPIERDTTDNIEIQYYKTVTGIKIVDSSESL